MKDAQPEVWMRGPVPDVDPLLQPVAHALLQVQEDLEALAVQVPDRQAWLRPGGAASIGFHVRHIGGATDRLLTYARGEALTPDQFTALKAEGVDTGATIADVARASVAIIDRALIQLRATPPGTLLEPRTVGRAQLPSTRLGLLFHAAEHATRHAGQALTTARILSGLDSLGDSTLAKPI